jgi:very-short-patch-repair endonuclease
MWQQKIPRYNNRLQSYARENRKAGNLSEILLWNRLKNGQLRGLDFDRQVMIGEYIADFCCKGRRVVIEIDGDSHDSRRKYDECRDKYMSDLGIAVIRINDADVKQRMGLVWRVLENHPRLQA